MVSTDVVPELVEAGVQAIMNHRISNFDASRKPINRYAPGLAFKDRDQIAGGIVVRRVRMQCATHLPLPPGGDGAHLVEVSTLTTPNLIGFKGGTGQIGSVREISATLGNRLCYIGVMPTHELFAQADNGTGVTTCSSAVFKSVPELALRFFNAMRCDNKPTIKRNPKEFHFSFARIRDRVPGYAVSIIKSGGTRDRHGLWSGAPAVDRFDSANG
jgi:hypothetical protein